MYCRPIHLHWYPWRRLVSKTAGTASDTCSYVLGFIHLSPCLTSFHIAVRNRLWNNAGFFFLVWAVHYAPFFLMNRQLFIHHYLPSHLATALIAGAVLNYILSGDTINYPLSTRSSTTNPRHFKSDLGLKGPIFVVLYGILLFFMYAFMAPLTYGTPG